MFLVILSGKCQKLEELESLKLAGTREMQRDEHKIWNFFFCLLVGGWICLSACFTSKMKVI